jgi:hypothetical protein
MKVLDLFCCCGGAAMGLSDNGNNKITGVDITNDHEYPFEFIGIDVFDLWESFFEEFDLIWASPPCQHYLPINKWRGNYYPDLVARTRQLLIETGKPFIIENVPGAPIRRDLLLCGEMFEDLRILRHRIFEFGNGFKKPLRLPHKKHKRTLDNRGNKTPNSYYACVSGHGGNGYSFSLKNWQNAMGIDWINKKTHLTQAIPPAYSNYIITGKVKHVKQLEDFLYSNI